jgi:hypothetical protein
MIEEQVEQGVFLETPHYSTIERAAVTLGLRLSRRAQERGAREIAAMCDSEVTCPTCQSTCQVETKTRDVISIDWAGELTEAVAHCRKCRRSFFPAASADGNR